MDEKKAFPCKDGCLTQTGMDLRDWFAGQALNGVIAIMVEDARNSKVSIKDYTEKAYVIADAMMEARKKEAQG